MALFLSITDVYNSIFEVQNSLTVNHILIISEIRKLLNVEKNNLKNNRTYILYINYT